jgi:hypothetical protein
VTGIKSWKDSGNQEHTAGEAEVQAAKSKGYTEGTLDRVGGKKDGVVGAVAGDRQQEAAGEFTLYFVGLCARVLTNI